jgi:hypothetical protein
VGEASPLISVHLQGRREMCGRGIILVWIGILVLMSGAFYVTIVHCTRSQVKSCRILFAAGVMANVSYSGMPKFFFFCVVIASAFQCVVFGHIPLDVSYNFGCPHMSVFRQV